MNYNENNQSHRDNLNQDSQGSYLNNINGVYLNPQYKHHMPIYSSPANMQQDIYPQEISKYLPGDFNPPFVGISPVQNTKQNKTKKLGKKKIKLEYIPGRNKRNVTFSKRKKGIMKKAFELNILTGSDILLLVASPSGHVYTFATPKLMPMVTEHKNIIKTCLGKEDNLYKNHKSNIPEMENIDICQETISLEDFLE